MGWRNPAFLPRPAESLLQPTRLPSHLARFELMEGQMPVFPIVVKNHRAYYGAANITTKYETFTDTFF